MDFVVVDEKDEVVELVLFGEVDHFVDLAFLAFAIAHESVDFGNLQSAICGVYFFAQRKSGSDGNADTEGARAIPNAVNMAGDVAFVD